MTYQVLARSWRPQRFADIIGQDAVVQTLQNAIASGTLGQAYLFSGLRGVGKTTAARLLAMAVNCEQGPTPEPCGECVPCQEVAAGSSIDVVELDAATHTGVDNVRDIQEMLRYRPARDRFRVMIVDEVHMLSKSAFNALLKTIEEPPPYILWVFATTERNKVPATILSRCQQLEFRPVAEPLIVSHLTAIAEKEGFTLSAEAASAVARAAEGSIRDGLSLIDQLRAFSGDHIDEAAVAAVLGVPRTEQMAALVGLLARGDAAGALALLRDELAAGHDPVLLYAEVGRALRHLVHAAVDPGLESDLTDENRRNLDAAGDGLDATARIRMLALWVEQEGLLRGASNRELALEVACLRLSRWPAVRRMEALLAGGGEPPAPAVPPPERGTAGGAPPAAEPVEQAGSPHPQGSPGRTLSEALWPERPRIAAAVDSAAVTLDGGILRLSFAPEHAALAGFLRSPKATEELQRKACKLPGGCERVDLLVVAGNGTDTDLARVVDEDEQVRLVRGVLGGEIVAVSPDHVPSEAEGETG